MSCGFMVVGRTWTEAGFAYDAHMIFHVRRSTADMILRFSQSATEPGKLQVTRYELLP